MVKNIPANAGDIRDVGHEDLLEKGMATHSSILVWRIPWTEEPGRLQDKMIGWHHQLNGHESEQTLGDTKGQRSLACAVHGASNSRT